MRRLVLLCVVSVASLWLATGALAAPPWEGASAARLALSDAEAAIILGDPAAVQAKVDTARGAVEGVLAGRPADLAAARRSLDDAEAAATRLDATALAGARAAVWTTILHASFERAVDAARRGDLAEARAWLLVREFRPPTRFTRAAADGTLALERLGDGDDDAGRRRDHGPPRSARHVRRPDPLDAGGARRGSWPRLRRQSRGGGRPRPRLLGDPRPVVPGAARRARMAGDHGRGRGAGGGDAHGQRESARPCSEPRAASRASARHRCRPRRRSGARASSTGSSASSRSSTDAA